MKNQATQTVNRNANRGDRILRRALYIIERFVAVLTIIVLLGALGREIYHIFHSGAAYFEDVSHMLHNLLTIVVGLEFVRMLIDTTPASILEVLTVAITRYVILEHEDPWSNLASVVCIAGLFAVRRFLIRQSEMKEELVETE